MGRAPDRTSAGAAAAGGGAPSGAAGGDLTGTYPDPGIAAGVIVNADVNASAAIAKTKLASLDVVDADVNTSAAIAYSKLALGTSIVNADISASAAIAATKLSGVVPSTTWTAKGDILAASAASTPVRLAVGTNGHILTANDALPSGVGWAAPVSGPYPQTFSGMLPNVAGGVGAANRCWYMLVTVGPAQTVNTLYCNVGTQSGNMSFAVFSSTGTGRSRAPATRLATTGAIAVPAGPGEAVGTLDATVTVTPYETWFAISCDNTTAQFTRITGNSAITMKGLAVFQATAHPAPTSAASLTDGNTPFWISGALI